MAVQASLSVGVARVGARAYDFAPVDGLTITRLDNTTKAEVLAFLNQRPECTFMMSGLILDNGLESPLNRGTFYGCRDAVGRLHGVTLIGEITMLEATSEAALAALAGVMRNAACIYMIIGEQRQVSSFWSYCADVSKPMRLFCREHLLELHDRLELAKPVPGLRLATPDDLEPVMAVHARMALEESNIDPLVADPQGFRERCARRVRQGRSWICTEGKRLVFKADVISETPEITYLEGVYVSPQERGQGMGARSLSQLSAHLLTRSKSICLLVNERNLAAQALYRKCGYEFRKSYDTIFL
jgi:predicted GNAT family acetyltransferase